MYAYNCFSYLLFLCSLISVGHIRHRVSVNVTVPTWESLNANIHVSSLNDTAATNTVAIVVPYRDRESHLKLFLQHMHPFLQKQKLTYRIYVIEQVRCLNWHK